jgi:hypothetical protein
MQDRTSMPDEIVRRDAAVRLDVDPTTINISRHEQLFPSTACGFPGMGGAMMTTAEVVVATTKQGGACVYVADRLCYLVREPNDDFWADMKAQQLSSASRYTGQYDRVPRPPEEAFVLKGSKKAPTDFRHIIDTAYTQAHPIYNSKQEAKTTTVLRASDNAVMCVITPVEQGGFPHFNFTEEANQYQFDGLFPRLGVFDAESDEPQLPTAAGADSPGLGI